MNNLEYWSAVSSHQNRSHALEESLVLTAVNIENELRNDGNRWLVMVNHAQLEDAKTQLRDFHLENTLSAEKAVEAVAVDNGWLGVLGFLAVIWLMPTLEALTSAQLLQSGALTHEGIIEGEWYRAITALTLHGDIAVSYTHLTLPTNREV